MTISLYDASVASYLQLLPAVGGFLDKGLAHFREHDVDPEEVGATRLYPDMHPFRYQIHATVHHSLGAVEGLRSGKFSPPSSQIADDYAALQAKVAAAQEALAKITPDEINARAGRDVVFQIRTHQRIFTTEDFVLSFSLPNFHFHATTAYDILRAKGVNIGKRDFLGAFRTKG